MPTITTRPGGVRPGRARPPRRAGALAALGLAAGALAVGAGSAAAATCTDSAGTRTCAFSYSGAPETFTVPAGVTSLGVGLVGGSGGAGSGASYYYNAPGGKGASVTATLPVSPGDTLQVRVGGAARAVGGGEAGYNGGGTNPFTGNSYQVSGSGGGASDIRTGDGLADRIVVAGGGGGGGGNGQGDGTGGDLGSKGGAGGDAGSAGQPGIAPGGGAGVAGGAVGTVLGVGGTASSTTGSGGKGGAGGGGYFGGGAGAPGLDSFVVIDGAGVFLRGGGGGGGGGSSYVTPSATASSVGVATGTGNGRVTISFAAPQDSTAPLVSVLVSPATPDGLNGWYRGDVSIDWTVTEDESAASLQLTGCVDRSITADQLEVAYGCTGSSDGGVTAATDVRIKRDGTAPAAPTLSADRAPEYAGGGGWYRNSVTVTTTANGDPAPGSGVDPTSVPAARTVATSGTQTLTGTVSDRAGNTSTPGGLTVRVDATAPQVGIVCPAGDVVLGSTATASWSASDAHSGLSGSATGTVTLGTSTVGTRTASSPTVSDNVGLTASASCTYRVVYPWTGFVAPVDNPPAVNLVTAGQAVPVKFSLGGDRGLGILAAGSPSSAPVACTSVTPDVLEQYAPTGATSGLKYDAASRQYNYTWKTERSWAGTCRRLSIALIDGTTRTALFRFR